MAYVVAKKSGRFEARESMHTPKGPRSRTLISFEELTDEAIEKARQRATKPLAAEDLKKAARRVGAPVARKPVDAAARDLIAELARGRSLDPTLSRILLALLEKGHREGVDPSPANEAARDVAEWMAATPAERGKALVDLLLLADALPSGGRRGKPLEFPRLDSSRHG
jgi:hypothetical protein